MSESTEQMVDDRSLHSGLCYLSDMGGRMDRRGFVGRAISGVCALFAAKVSIAGTESHQDTFTLPLDEGLAFRKWLSRHPRAEVKVMNGLTSLPEDYDGFAVDYWDGKARMIEKISDNVSCIRDHGDVAFSDSTPMDARVFRFYVRDTATA